MGKGLVRRREWRRLGCDVDKKNTEHKKILNERHRSADYR